MDLVKILRKIPRDTMKVIRKKDNKIFMLVAECNGKQLRVYRR